MQIITEIGNWIFRPSDTQRTSWEMEGPRFSVKTAAKLDTDFDRLTSPRWLFSIWRMLQIFEPLFVELGEIQIMAAGNLSRVFIPIRHAIFRENEFVSQSGT